MPNAAQVAMHPSRAALVAAVNDYLSKRGGSARWFGLLVAGDP